jgi:hypothetical protein
MAGPYYTPPANLVPLTVPHASVLNNDFSGVAAAFSLVAVDMSKTFRHATLSLTPLSQTALQMAGKLIGLDATGLNLIAAPAFGTWRGPWVTATGYNPGDVVTDPNAPYSVYASLKVFTSGVSVAADVAAGNLVLAIDLSQLPQSFPITTETASFSAAISNLYLINSGSATINVATPATPVVGNSFAIAIHPAYTGTLTIVYNGTDKINGVSSSAVLFSNSGIASAARIWYSGTTNGWIIGGLA